MYVGVTPHPSLVGKKEKYEKKEKEAIKIDSEMEKGSKEKDEKERKISLGRKFEYGMLLVAAAKIYCPNVKALIPSGATRCFVTLAYVNVRGFKAKPQDIFLELGNGERFLSQGLIPDVPIVTTGLTVKID